MGTAIFIFVLVSIALCAIFLMRIYSKERRDWNKGRCKNCNTEWSLIDCDGHMRIYKCDNCNLYIAMTTDADY